MIQLLLPTNYEFLVLANVVYSFMCVVVGFVVVYLFRRSIFTPEFMAKHFTDEHKKAFGTAPPKQGYPDNGNGKFMHKASFK